MDTISNTPVPSNEPIRSYRPGSAERASVATAIDAALSETRDFPARIGGRWEMGTGERIDVVRPDAHSTVLGVLGDASSEQAAAAIAAAEAAATDWRDMCFDDRASIFLRAAEMLSGPWRDRLNAATMLGQSKTVFQAEIDAACELIDYWRFGVSFARELLAEQPDSSAGTWNRVDHRPLEGFVYAITPFNFTCTAGNLATAPALMGNTVIWKPSPTQQFSASLTMQLLMEAGLPDGVINMLPGDGLAVSQVALAHPNLAGIHFTGSTATFQALWQQIAINLPKYRDYPRIVGETGGKDFILAHPSAEHAPLVAALIRGAFEYQGQKCSAVSRAYIARSVWNSIRDDLLGQTDALAVGEVTDFTNFLGAVIDRRAFDRLSGTVERAKADSNADVLVGGRCDASEGFFIRPTIIQSADPGAEYFSTEYFGPIMSIFVYEDGDWDAVLNAIDCAAPYALSGAVFSSDRASITQAMNRLRYTAGDFYVNDKPTGAVVGQQPWGGSRKSGTNDKAGSGQNLLRWTTTRAIKETFNPPGDYRYPYMG